MVNNKNKQTIDTGSKCTVVRESAAKEIGSEINQRRSTPHLHGVTASPLTITGMVWLDIGVGGDHIHQQWIPVVPDRYLDVDLLLGTDLISKALFTWNAKENNIVWGGACYVVRHARKRKGTLERIHQASARKIQHSAPDDFNGSKRMNLIDNITIEPYQFHLIPVEVKEAPNTTLLVHPQPRVSQSSLPFLTKVTNKNIIYIPFVNNTKRARTFRIGTFLGAYEYLELETGTIRAIKQIHNDLIPNGDQAKNAGTRDERLKKSQTSRIGNTLQKARSRNYRPSFFHTMNFLF